MLYVQFYLNEYRYVLPTTEIIEIVPCVKLSIMKNAPAYVSGICNYRGDLVPVIDLCELFIYRPCEKKLSTRIIFLNTVNNTEKYKIVGLKVEKATETMKVDENTFMDAGVYSTDMPYIGPVISDNLGLISRVRPEDIFSQLDFDLLFGSS